MTEAALGPRKGMRDDEIGQTVEEILRAASLDEKVAMMSGSGFFKLYLGSGKRWGGDPYPAGSGCERLGVPKLYFTDGPRGVARGNSTCFPCTMARGATFDVDLERRIGEIMGIETRAQGCTLNGAVCVNLLRHPAWGRAQETYGEDPYLLGEMGAALAIGIQTHNVVATAKHFALNSMENARFKVDVLCDARSMREVYLPHFKRILDAGCMSVMSAYNQWNGEYCGQNRALLTDVLRGDWGFTGFVHSDWVFGLRAPFAASAGLDIENPEPLIFSGLAEAVRTGGIEPTVIDQACRRILKTQYAFAAAEDPLPEYPASLVARPEHVAVALEAALKSAVLLKNDAVLPFDRSRIGRLAVLGDLAALENTGDLGSSRVQPPYVVTPLAGLIRHLGEDAILTGGEYDLEAAAAAARAADAVVVVVGYTHEDEGEYIPGEGIDLGQAETPEALRRAAAMQGQALGNRPSIGGDRDQLTIKPAQVALIEAARASGKPVAVVIVAGSAVLIGDWVDGVGAVLQTFYSGMEGGTALARLLFGEVSPSGRLPFTVARDPAHYPTFDKNADRIVYDLWHGYTKLEREGVAPAFAFGFGLSYARFAYRALKARKTKDGLEAQVSVTNTGAMESDEVVQLYVGFPGKAVERPQKLLRGFTRVRLAPGETRTVRFSVPFDQLGWWSEAQHGFVMEPGAHAVFAGGSSQNEDLIRAEVVL